MLAFTAVVCVFRAIVAWGGESGMAQGAAVCSAARISGPSPPERQAIALGQREPGVEGRANSERDACRVVARDVSCEHGQALHVLAPDEPGPEVEADAGDVAEPEQLAVRRRDGQRLDVVDAVADVEST
jgi:hypothetical protein